MPYFGYNPYQNPSLNPSQYLTNAGTTSLGDFTVDVVKKASGLTKYIPFVGPIVSSGLQYLFDSIAAKKQRKIAKQQWDEMNRYNSPAAQLQRLKSAGLNPAYGAEHFNNQSATFSNASTMVSRAVAPDFLPAMSQYQTMKNAGIEEDILRERLGQEYAKNEFLNATLGLRVQKENQSLNNMLAIYDSTVARRLNDNMLSIAKKLLMDQEWENKFVMNPLQQALQKIMLENADLGLNSSDSTFLRVLARKMGLKQNANPNSLFPYVIGDRAASFAGDLLKIGIPSGAIAKMWNSTKP